MGLGVRSWLRLSAARGWLGLGLGPALGVCPIYAQPQKKNNLICNMRKKETSSYSPSLAD